MSAGDSRIRARRPQGRSPERAGGGWTRLRATLRLARRQVRRSLGSSALVAALVALPVAALGGAATFWASQQPSPAQRVALELGQAQSWIEPASMPVGWQQYVDEPNMLRSPPQWSADAAPEMIPAAADPTALLPASATTVPVAGYASTVVETAAGLGRVDTTVGRVWDPLFEGRYLLLEGRAPAADDEALVTPGLLDRLGARLGDEVVLHDADASFTITGLLRRADQDPADQALFLPPAALGTVGAQWSTWYVANWQPDLDGLAALNEHGAVAFARDLVLDPPAEALVSVRDTASSAFWAVLTIGAIAAVFGGYLTVLLAGAALSVSARRQQRTLAVAASVGASRVDLFRVVLLQGTVLGVIGGVAGLAVGVGGAAAVLAVTDRGVVGSVLAGNWGFRVPWPLALGILAFAIVAGTLAAIAPARGASRGDTLVALRGSRRPGTVHARRPLWGLVLMLAGLAAGIAGGVVTAALDANDPDAASNPLRVAALWAIVLGPIALQVGVILAGHWLLAQLSRGLSHLGLGARLASRDAAANPGRVVPAFAAIAACVFLASFVLSASAVTAAASARNYISIAPVGSVAVSFWAEDPADLEGMIATAHDLVSPSEPVATALILQPPYPTSDPETGELDDPGFPMFGVSRQHPDPDCPGCDGIGDGMLIVAPEEASTALGVPVDASALATMRTGGALLLDPGYRFDDGTVHVSQWRFGDVLAMNRDASATAQPVATHVMAAASVDVGRTMYPIAISPATARELGIAPVPRQLIASYDELPSQDVLDRMQADAEVVSASGTSSGLSTWVERGPGPADPWLWLTVAVAAVLVVGASAVCLGLARYERRPDDATLSAVGGGGGLRRRVNAWQALVIVGVGSVTGAAVGALPMQGIAMGSSGYLDGADTPWPWLAGIALGLPLAIALVSWLVPPRRAELTRRTAIA